MFHLFGESSCFAFENNLLLQLFFPAGSFDEQVVRDSFRKLLSARFIERCPVPGPLLTPPSEDAPPKKRGAKSAKVLPCNLAAFSMLEETCFL